MTNQEIKNLLDLCNQKTYIYNRNLYSAQKGDKIKFQSVSFQHRVQYNIGNLEIKTDYIQDSLYDASISSWCNVDDQLFKRTMVQSCKLVEDAYPMEAIQEEPKKEEVVVSSKRPDFPRSLSTYTTAEINKIVEELREAQDVEDYFNIKEKYNIHGASLKKLCRMYGLPFTSQLAANAKPLLRNRKLLSDDDELVMIQCFINIMADGVKSKEAIAQISKERRISPDILKDIYNENKNFISKKIPFANPVQKDYQELKRTEQPVKTSKTEEEVSDQMLQDLKTHFNG